jgi:mannose-6-phosphate isomerase-like protein (cupin superfamily)
MSDSDTATTYVFAPEDIVWHKTDLGPKFWLSDNLVGTDYTSDFCAQLTKFGPGGGSPPHRHTYNHAFYFLRGTCNVQIGEQTWDVEPGTLVPKQRDRTAILGPGGRCLGRRVGCLVWMSRAVRS